MENAKIHHIFICKYHSTERPKSQAKPHPETAANRRFSPRLAKGKIFGAFAIFGVFDKYSEVLAGG